MNDQTTLKREVAYRLGDPISDEEASRYSLERANGIMAVWTGEKRRPKKGERYLSGAVIHAYLAPNDLLAEYHIARLVKVETQTVQVISELEEKGG